MEPSGERKERILSRVETINARRSDLLQAEHAQQKGTETGGSENRGGKGSTNPISITLHRLLGLPKLCRC